MMTDREIGPDPSLLLVDDDVVFVERLARAMERARAAIVEAARAKQGL